MREGMLAEFEDPESLLRAVGELRTRGYRQLDAFTPYPVPGLVEALGLGRSPITWLVFPVALFGAGFAYFLQWFLNAYLYPLNVGGRPPHATPAFIIITFETTVLFTAVGALLLFLWMCRLPRLSHPIFEVEGFESASQDRFWLGINLRDPRFDPEKTEEELLRLGALKVAFAGGHR